jgi:LysM repeat protein
LERLLRLSDGIPRKINMLCHGAMLAALCAGQRKVTIGIAKQTAAEYLAAVGLAKPRYGVKLAAIGSTALASLMLLGLVYPNAWSAWVLNRAVSFGAVISHKTQPAMRGSSHQKMIGALAEAKISPLTLHPAKSGATIVSTATAAARTIAGPAPEGAAHIVPASPTLSAETQNPMGKASARDHRNQVTVRYGDTLEGIAMRYLGSSEGINRLIEANPHLTDINQLSVGQVIYLPTGVSIKPSHDQAEPAAAVAQTEDSAGGN